MKGSLARAANGADSAPLSACPRGTTMTISSSKSGSSIRLSRSLIGGQMKATSINPARNRATSRGELLSFGSKNDIWIPHSVFANDRGNERMEIGAASRANIDRSCFAACAPTHIRLGLIYLL